MPLIIRPHLVSDAAATLDVFHAAIRTTAAADYSAEQIEAWASPEINVDDWTARRMARTTVVAVIEGAAVGFTDVDTQGYIDMLFVDPTCARRGIATALLQSAVFEATQLGASSLSTHASVTARPFFEAHKFSAVEKLYPVIRGVSLQNYAMHRPI